MTQTAQLGAGTLLWDDYGIRTPRILVDLSTSTYVTIRLFTMFVEPGDVLILTGEANLTNNVGRTATGAVTGTRYPVGIATSLWVYDANAPSNLRAATWVRLGTNGENATVDGHHIQQGLTRPYVVPADWDPTHQMGIVLRVDAHSTGWDDNGGADFVVVEKHGVLMVARYRAKADDPRWLTLAELEGRVAALEQPTGGGA